MSLADSEHGLPAAPNRLWQRGQPTRPDAVWVAGITYAGTQEGFLYVAGVLDRCGRRCIGWAMCDSLATTLPLAALDMALTQRRPNGGLLHHSDQGVQYASRNYRRRLAEAGAVPSLSRRGDTATTTPPWKVFGAASNANSCIAALSTHAPKPAPPFLNGSKPFTTARGSTAPSASNPLWTLKNKSTKP